MPLDGLDRLECVDEPKDGVDQAKIAIADEAEHRVVIAHELIATLIHGWIGIRILLVGGLKKLKFRKRNIA